MSGTHSRATTRGVSPPQSPIKGNVYELQRISLTALDSAYRSLVRVALRCRWRFVHVCVHNTQRKRSQHLPTCFLFLIRSHGDIEGMCETGTAIFSFYVLPAMKRVEHSTGYINVSSIFFRDLKKVQQICLL